MHLLIALCSTVAFVTARPVLDSAPTDFGFPPTPPPRPAVFPPGFEELLPEEAKEKLIAAHDDQFLTYEARRDRIESVFDALPAETLEKLPLPPGLQRLPEEARAPFRALHVDRSIGWRERQARVDEMVMQLPEELQHVVAPPPPPRPQMANGFPTMPPAGFEVVLSPTVYKMLLAVHENPGTSVPEKKRQLNQLMRMVPQEQLDRLPLPSGFERLPAETLQRVKALMHDFDLEWDQRHEKVMDFIRQLPREERRLLRKPAPPGFEALPDEVRDQIDDLFANNKLNPMERNQKIHDLLVSLPAELRAKFPPPPPVLPVLPVRQLNDDTQKAGPGMEKESPSFV